MLFLAASKGNYFTVDSGMWLWVEHCSNLDILFRTRYLAYLQVKSCSRSVYTFNFKTKTKAARRREGLQNRIIQVVKNNKFAIVD